MVDPVMGSLPYDLVIEILVAVLFAGAASLLVR